MPSLHKDVKAQVDATRLPPILSLIQGSQLIKQGAEAKVYKSMLFPQATTTPPAASTAEALPVLLKHRFPKHYRHPTLDAQLTRQRLTSEARALVRCLKAGVKVPGLRCVDLAQGVLGMEWVEGWSVREVLGGGQDGDELPDDEETETSEEESAEDIEEMLRRKGVDPDQLLLSIGAEIGKMHLAEIIHGDLTTSNMMVRLVPTPATPNDPPFELVLIDFGLSSTSFLAEDRAVDLYVLERAFASTHPVPLLPSGEEGTPHFTKVLEGYERTMREKGKKGEWERIEKRLDEVRLRGRKRSMVG